MSGKDPGAGAGKALAQAWPGLLDEDRKGPFVKGGKCGACGFVALSPQPICPSCWAEGTMADYPIGRTGRLYSSTVIHALPAGFEAPYSVGYVNLEQGMRIFAHLEGGKRQPAIGEELELTIAAVKQDSAGAWLTGPCYRRRQQKKSKG